MSQLFASIIIDISHENVDKLFQYRVPKALEDEVNIGSLVFVPFGNGNRRRKGYVIELSEVPEYDITKIKEIAGVVSGGITADSQLIQLAWWMKEQYGSTMNQALKTVLPVKKKVKSRNKAVIESLLNQELDGIMQTPVLLNEEQQDIVSRFQEDWSLGKRIPYLIHGITGSGKTEIYMEMIDCVVKQGRQAIVLIPEIALTYQTVMRFYKRFGNQVCVMHSKLSQGERYDQFERAKNGEATIMIGPRSALFTPFSHLGLIIMDEEHESAYKSEGAPRYHAREVAEKIANMQDAIFIMGSATPSLEAYAKAEAGIYQLCTLKTRASKGSQLASTQIIDLREELKTGNKSIFSRALQEQMAISLKNKEQIMLFMNRRGYSRFVSCRSCGEAIKCPHCDVSLTLHNNNQLVCHYCGHHISLPKTCPTCGSNYLAGFGVGTQQIEEMTKVLFPSAKVLRMDLDTTSKKGGHEAILSAFANQKADILIGTQMIVKGHDFPNVTLVGILAADVSLHAPDYRCGERTFQLLVQAIGRAGRSSKAGVALIQTYDPEHYSITTAASQDYERFYELEMGYRRMMNYPPACHMLSLVVSGMDEEIVIKAMEFLAYFAHKAGVEGMGIIGPVEAPLYKLNDKYRKILYMKYENYAILVKMQKYLQGNFELKDRWKDCTIQWDFS